jgi:hypothetical protein
MENGLNFEKPLRLLRQKRVARAGWNGAGMFAYIVPASQYPAITGVAKEYWRRKLCTLSRILGSNCSRRRSNLGSFWKRFSAEDWSILD